jgi:hypothetical protein
LPPDFPKPETLRSTLEEQSVDTEPFLPSNNPSRIEPKISKDQTHQTTAANETPSSPEPYAASQIHGISNPPQIQANQPTPNAPGFTQPKQLATVNSSQAMPEKHNLDTELSKRSLIFPRREQSMPLGERHTGISEARSIRVHIGTIEVHAIQPPQPVREIRTERLILSLDEYLRRRNEGKI